MALFTTVGFILKHPLNKTRKIRAIFDFFKWQLGSRLVPGEVIFTWINNSKFIVFPGETGLTQNIYCGLHEFQEMAYMLHVLSPDDLFVDIGANVGSYTILACAVKGARGYCFEPVPSTFERLTRNIRLNELDDRVKAFNIGLADKENEILFTSGLNTTNHVVASGEFSANTVKVKVFPLDVMLCDETPSLIKIDVEGLESSVLNGMQKILQATSLHSIIMEVNGSGNRYGYEDSDLINTMQRFGFYPHEYDPFARKLTSLNLHNRSSGNILFLRNKNFIVDRLVKAAPFKIWSLEI